MPGKFTDKNGANLAGHSDKWSDKNRRPNSHMAGQGSRGSRNMGTGMAGKANTVASQGTDTSNMSKIDKLKYFNSLGLLNPQQKQELQALENPAPQQPQPKQEPVQQAPAKANPVKELSDKLGMIFKSKPQLLQGIVNDLKAVKPEDLKDTAQRILDAMQKNTSTDPVEVYKIISQSINPHQVPHSTDVQSEPDDIKFDDEEEEVAQKPKGNAGGVMTPEEFHRDFDYLGKSFVDGLIKQANYFEDPDKALFHISMATDNVDDINDDADVRNSMASAADDLDGFFKPKAQDEEDVDFDVVQKDVEKNADLPDSTEGIPKPEYEDFGSDKDGYDIAVDVYKAVHKNPELSKSLEPVFANAWDNYQSLGYDRPAEAGYFEVLKKLQEMGLDPFKEAEEGNPEMDNELAQDRNFGPRSQEEMNRLLDTIAMFGKNAGASKKSVNNNLSWVKNKIGTNGRKLQKAYNALIDGFDDMSLESPDAYEFALNLLDSAFENYEKGDVTPHEKDIMSKYGK